MKFRLSVGFLGVVLVAGCMSPADSVSESAPPNPSNAAMGATAAVNSAACSPANTIDVLFIGNSYTRLNSQSVDIPATYKALADDAGKCVNVDSLVVLGSNLQAMTSAATAKINTADWDIVVLQDNSNNYWSGGAFQAAANNLKSVVEQNNPCSRTLLYLIPAWNDPWSASTQTAFTNTTLAVQNFISEGTVPAGEGWREAAGNFSLASLFDDSQHPSELGEYLIAASFFARIHDESAVGLAPLPGVTASQAAQLQAFADAAVFDGSGDMSAWESGPVGGAMAPRWCSGICPKSERNECGDHVAEIIQEDPADCKLETPFTHGSAFQPSGWRWYSGACGCGYIKLLLRDCEPHAVE